MMLIRLLSLILLISSGWFPVAGQNSNHALYGYFFYTIAKNIEWPTDYKTGDFIIGVIGETPVTGHLKTMASKKDISGRPIKIAEYTSVSQIGKCNILFLPADRSDDIEDIIGKLDGMSTLIVSEKNGMAMRGSCINFVTTSAGKLAFELNKAAVDKANLKVASELTRFAIML